MEDIADICPAYQKSLLDHLYAMHKLRDSHLHRLVDELAFGQVLSNYNDYRAFIRAFDEMQTCDF